MDTLAARLKYLRGDKNQTEFGADFGLSQRSISRYETGGGSPDIHTITQISAKYGVSPQWLAFGAVESAEKINSQEQMHLKARVAELESEVAELKTEITMLKEEALNAYREILRIRRASPNEPDKGGSGIIDVPASAPSAPLHGRTNK
mgnify:CR=1 FL=1